MCKPLCKFSHCWPESNRNGPVHLCTGLHAKVNACPLYCRIYQPRGLPEAEGAQALVLKIISSAMIAARLDSPTAADAAFHWAVVYGEDPFVAAELIHRALRESQT